MFRDASNPDPQIASTSVGVQASQLAKLMADNAALRSKINRQAIQVANSQQAGRPLDGQARPGRM